MCRECKTNWELAKLLRQGEIIHRRSVGPAQVAKTFASQLSVQTCHEGNMADIIDAIAI